MNGFAIIKQNNTEKLSVGFGNRSPATDAAIRLNYLLGWMIYHLLYPFKLNASSIRSETHRMKILCEFHSNTLSMTEMSEAGKDHRQAMFVRRCDDFFITHGTAGLNDGFCTRRRQHVDAVAKREEGVG